MIKFFRTISILEGLSYLVILSVTLGVIDREWVFSLGMAHGVLFFLYLVLSLIVSGKNGWSVWVWLLLFAASVVPFAFILVELYLRKIELRNNPELEVAVK
jgi:integral membrane protein